MLLRLRLFQPAVCIFLILIKRKAYQIPCLIVSAVKLIFQLFDAILPILVSVPEFKLYDVLLLPIGHNNIHSGVVSRLRLHIVKTCSIDNRL